MDGRRSGEQPKTVNPGSADETIRYLAVRGPADRAEAGHLVVPTRLEIEKAVANAARSFHATKHLATFQRSKILRKVAELLTSRAEELAINIAREAGKPIRSARGEVDRSVATFLSAAAEVDAGTWEAMPLDMNAASAGRWGIVKRFPLGPVLAITPFNFPLNLVAHKVAPAIAVGAPIVNKPATKTPLSARALREIVVEAGWPQEAYAFLPIPGAETDALVRDPRLPVISFTGSSAVGWKLREAAPRKRVSLELGGNAAVIVHGDADPVDAAARAVGGAFGYAGQSCISVQRILVHRSLFHRFRDELLEKTAHLVMGDPLEEATDVGPMISEAEAERALLWIEEAVAQGAQVLAGGHGNDGFVEPTVLTETTRSMKVESHEVFAPVVTLNAYDDFDEALRRVNDSVYGLQAGLFTRDLGLVQKAFEALEVGALVVNDVPTWRADRMPYGGVKESGTGREGPRWAMEELTEPRLLVLRSPG